MTEPFFFGVPLLARRMSRDWPLTEHLFGLMLRSLLAQTDPDFRMFLAAHDVPESWSRVARDARFTLVKADWAPGSVTAANDDGGMKKWLIKQAVRGSGGGLLMFVDADDWVPRGLVQAARATIGREDVGAIVAEGVALDYASLCVAPLPIGGGFDQHFAELCGSCTIARLAPMDDLPLRYDPHGVLGSHHRWEEAAAAAGIPLRRLPVQGLYMMGTGLNHSETEGPFTSWRRALTARVRSIGTPVADDLLADYGQAPGELRPGRAPPPPIMPPGRSTSGRPDRGPSFPAFPSGSAGRG